MRTNVEVAQIARMLEGQPDHLCDLFLQLREFIRGVVPEDTDEMMRWGGLFYCKGGGVIKGNICGIGIKDDCVQLGFVHGAFLPDPDHVLSGDQKSKRQLEVRSMKEFPKAAVRKLIAEAAAYQPGEA